MQPSFGIAFLKWTEKKNGHPKKTPQPGVCTMDAAIYRPPRQKSNGVAWRIEGPGQEFVFRLVGVISGAIFRVDVCEAWEPVGIEALSNTAKDVLIRALKDKIQVENGLTITQSFNRFLLMDARELQ